MDGRGEPCCSGAAADVCRCNRLFAEHHAYWLGTNNPQLGTLESGAVGVRIVPQSILPERHTHTLPYIGEDAVLIIKVNVNWVSGKLNFNIYFRLVDPDTCE